MAVPKRKVSKAKRDSRRANTLKASVPGMAECPQCHDKLRLCGLPLDSVTHGLYKCTSCDKRVERR